MLKITMQDSADALRVRLEGKLCGAWVTELEDCWRASVRARGTRAPWVDLTGVDCVDSAGRYLLALMYRAGARFQTAGCVMPALIEEIAGKWPGDGPRAPK